MNRGRKPRFVRQYADVGSILLDAAKRFGADVRGGEYPDAEHSYS
jgi:3-methyl-2-oxobutanoate hydroxymethyltransferase